MSEEILYEYNFDEKEDVDDEFGIRFGRQRVFVTRREGYDYETERKIFNYDLKPHEIETYGIVIECNKKMLYGGSASFSFSFKNFRKIIIAIDKNDNHLSLKLEL